MRCTLSKMEIVSMVLLRFLPSRVSMRALLSGWG